MGFGRAAYSTVVGISAISPLTICSLIGSSGLEVLGRRLLADRPEADAVLLQPEDRVAPALRSRRDRLDRGEDGGVHLLLRARQDVGAEEGLVGVDADPPHLLLAGRVERPEPAAARNLEDDAGAAGDLVERELLALRLVVPIGRVAVQDLDPGDGLLGAGLVARDEAVDRRLLEAADRADHVRAVAALLGERGEVAGEVPDLLLLEDQADDVLRLVLQPLWSTSMIAKLRSGNWWRPCRSRRPARSRRR